MIRLSEITLCLVGLVIISPIILVVWIFVYFDVGTPFFIQKRVGKDQKPFQLIKFRTMQISTQDLPTHEVGAHSITRSGKWLRKTKLDELPQLINVLKGEMSLVGPRPCLPSQGVLVRERKQRGIFKVLPGVTGLSQIHGVDMSNPRRLARYDALFVKNYSLKLYLYCLLKTVLGSGVGDPLTKQSKL